MLNIGMIKNLFIFICLCLPLISFGQSKALVDSINKAIGPGYVLDVDTVPPYHAYSSFKEVDLTGDGKKEIVIAAAKQDTIENTDTNKIFVLERTGNQLHILDSSTGYDVDGRGPSIAVRGLTLTVTHTFHHGQDWVTFQFNREVKKYTLVTIGYEEVEPNAPKQGRYTTTVREYNVTKQLASESTTVGSYQDEIKETTTTKRTSKKLPATISLKLGDLKDPSEYGDVFE